MTNTSVREQLDKLIAETINYDKNKIPSDLLADLANWKWGSYGWVSPASLIVTAAWRKFFYPSFDCCKIWAKDENNVKISDSYSIRSEDEAITIPLLAKYDLCKGFCSDNSGMQGSRAIEKMRGLKRLNTNFSVSQKTVFDLRLFASILNKINLLNLEQALEVIRYLIVIAKNIQKERKDSDLKLFNTNATFSILDFLDDIEDPELAKCVVAACLEAIYSPHEMVMEGVTDYKTASDARAKKPGDIALFKDNLVAVAAEVKDKSISLDWQNISRAEKIIELHPTIEVFIFALGNRSSVASNFVQEVIKSDRLSTEVGKKISFLSIHDLCNLAHSIVSKTDLLSRIGKYLSLAPSVKPKTKEQWIKYSAIS